MKRRLLTLLAGAACLAWTADSRADQPQPSDQQPPKHERQGPPGQAPGAHGRPAGQAAGQPHVQRAPQTFPGGVVAPQHVAPGAGAPQPGAAPQFQRRQGEFPRRGGQPTPTPVVPQPGAPRPQFQQRPGEFQHRAPNLPQPGVQPPQAAHPAGARPGAPAFRPPQGRIPQLGDWNRALRGRDRDVQGQAWREHHRGWDRDAPWRRDRNWWRQSSAFRLFLGPRVGFFFIPEFGYVSVPSIYEHRYWRPGERLPRWFWTYEVRDYWTYGLPPPPPGCAWVWVGRDIALIDLDDGYILDVVREVW